MVKIFLRVFLFLILFSFCLLFLGCSSSNFNDIKLNNDSSLYATHGEVCENPYIKVKCSEGLVCREVTTKPYFLKICLYPNESLPEDFTYKHTYYNDNFLKNKKKEKNNLTNNS